MSTYTPLTGEMSQFLMLSVSKTTVGCSWYAVANIDQNWSMEDQPLNCC